MAVVVHGYDPSTQEDEVRPRLAWNTDLTYKGAKQQWLQNPTSNKFCIATTIQGEWEMPDCDNQSPRWVQWSLLLALHTFLCHSCIESQRPFTWPLKCQEGWSLCMWLTYCLLSPKLCLLCENECVPHTLSSVTCHLSLRYTLSKQWGQSAGTGGESLHFSLRGFFLRFLKHTPLT